MESAEAGKVVEKDNVSEDPKGKELEIRETPSGQGSKVSETQSHLPTHITYPSTVKVPEKSDQDVADVGLQDAMDDTDELRRSARPYKPTEKGREYKENILDKRIWSLSKECKAYIKRLQDKMDSCCTIVQIMDTVQQLEEKHSEITRVYEELRETCAGTPSPETRQEIDRITSELDTALRQSQTYMVNYFEQLKKGSINTRPKTSHHEESDIGTVRDKRSISHYSKHTRDRSIKSRHSSSTRSSRTTSTRSSASSTASRKLEAAAEAAALKAELDAYKEEARHEDELQQMEIDETKRQADGKADETKRQANANAKIAKKQREIEKQKITKRLSMEKAKLQVYQEEETGEEACNHTCSEGRNMPVQASATEGCPDQATPSKARGDPVPNSDFQLNPVALAWSPPQRNELSDIAKAFADSVNFSRLPMPEPSIFSGDPLKYPDWESSFLALIESRSIPAQERIHYLKKYLGGPAKESVSGYFLLKSDNAYGAAKKVLQERYGNPFVVTQAFREKLDTWPKIKPRSGEDLRRFSDFLMQCQVAMIDIKELEILNDSHENRKMLQKLPDWIVTRWSRLVITYKKLHGSYPPFSNFVGFLTTEAEIACDPVTSLSALKVDPEREKDKSAPSKKRPGAYSHAMEVKDKGDIEKKSSTLHCQFCSKDNHIINDCRALERKTLTERKEYVMQNRLCFGCLKPGHVSKLCRNRSTCKKCQKRHPSCLHENNQKSSETEGAIQKEKTKMIDPGKQNEREFNSVTSKITSHRILHEDGGLTSSMIVPVWVSSKYNPDKEQLVYALLDTQSDTSFILEETGKTLKVNSEPVQLRLSTMTERDKIIHCAKYRDLTVRGYDSNIKIPLSVAYTREFIPVAESHIPTTETARRWSHLKCIENQIHPLQSCEVGLLIGYNCPQALAPRSCIAGEGNQPYAVLTDLGWSIVGKTDPYEDSEDFIGHTHRIITQTVPDTLRPRTDSPNIPAEAKHIPTRVQYVCNTKIKEEMIPPLDVRGILESDFAEGKSGLTAVSQDDMKFLKLVRENIHQDENGHYVMPLPFREGNPHLPNNKVVARRRLDHLKRRLQSDKKYFTDYGLFMQEIIGLGHAERAPEVDPGETIWYIPHHGVYNPKKPDKIRVVFDCSSKYKGTSLNDHLLQGPDMINALIGILCRFRQEPVAFMCDVEKMFHQFRVREADRNYLRFLWWEGGNIDLEPVEYRMNVHLFGAVSSPGCANFGLKQIAIDYKTDFGAEAANFIDHDFYVDDGLKSVCSTSKAITLIQDARNMCAKGNLRLHKFISNSREVLESIPPSEHAKEIKDLDLSWDKLPIERALGVQWCVESDCFQFRLCIQDQPLTRRGILSTVASIYDPLGFLAPFVLTGKQILQEMCRDGADWDDPLPDKLHQRWKQWREELPLLSNLKIKRCFKPPEFGTVKQVELHHFSDASQAGYGQCSYLRLVDDSHRVYCSLVMGKARVAPLKIVTIPRLELQAAVVSVKVSNVINKELNYTISTEHFWTDSKVVLGYINNDARRFHVYVANRVQTIRNSTGTMQWKYVSTGENPADHASRALSATDLLSSNWFTGPSFLWQREISSGNQMESDLCPDDPEVKKTCFLTTNCKEEKSLLDRLKRFSDWSKLIKAISTLQRFLSRRKGKGSEETTNTVRDKQNAEITVIKLAQREAFPEEIESLESPLIEGTRVIKKSSRLYKLDPFVDEQGVLRVGGRLSRSTLLYGAKYPAILPRDSHVSNLIIKHFHERVAHQGRGMTVNELRSSGFWILGCSSAVSSHIFHCVPCRRSRGCKQDQKMADLPTDRVEPSPPFTYCGMDCFGPFYVKDGRKEVKRYGLLFTCMSSRAVHIELLDDMSSDAFLNSLRCFIALRGPVRHLRCDQGTNFVGAKHELGQALKEMKEDYIKCKLLHQDCDFLFNPPSSSHMGGVWERQIRTIRSVLTAILDQESNRLDTSSLRTYFYEVMAIINSRPLTVENLNNPCDLEPLTPNHLLTTKSRSILPPPGNFVKEDVYARKRWRKVQYLADAFWLRWRKEYLQNLQSRQKWNVNRRNFQVGDIVVLKDEAQRNQWKLARIVETHPSKDGLVRKVRLLVGDSTLSKTGKRVAKPTFLDRPIHKLTLLLETSEN